MNTQTFTTSQKTITHKVCPLCASKEIQLAIPTKDFSISKEHFDLYDCTSCSFRFTQNIPSPQTIGPYYKSDVYISHSDTKKGLVNKLYHLARAFMLNRKLALIQSFAEGKRLLDIGSGTGYFLNHLLQNGYEVHGIEVDREARELTKKKFGIDIDEPGALLNNQLTTKVDVITLWHVLEHLHNPEIYMQCMHNQLTTNGTLFIAVPNHTAYEANYYKQYWAGYDVPRHLWHFTPKTIALLAEKTGFKVVAQKRLPLDPFYNALLSEQYQNSSLALFKGAAIGGIALLNSYLDASKSSSPIYILKKKD